MVADTSLHDKGCSQSVAVTDYCMIVYLDHIFLITLTGCHG